MVEGARLEIVWAGDRLGGSNPLASAKLTYAMEMRSVSSGPKEIKTRACSWFFID